MTLSVKLNACIDSLNFLEKPTQCIGEFLDKHPTIYKITLIVNHLFRGAMMVGLMFIPNVPLYASMLVCFAGSLFYRLTVEKNCAYKFALPAFFGAAAFMLALPSFIHIMNGTAFLTFGSGILNCSAFLPLILYGSYLCLTVDHEVNKQFEQMQKKRCECSELKED